MKKGLLVFWISIFILSCSTFIDKKTKPLLDEYGSKIYVLLKDVTAGDKSLTKGTEIRLILKTDKAWIKVYGYSTKVDELSADRVLLLYMFKEDFKKEKFNMELFNSKLDEIISVKK